MNIPNKLFHLSLLCIALLFTGCGDTDSRLYVVEKHDLYGYVNAKGDTVIDCKYPFSYTDTIEQIGFVVNKKGKIECFNNKGKFLFYVFNFDNGPDYIEEGYFRILDHNGLFGFADSLGNVVIKPQYKFAGPFKGGKAEVTYKGKMVPASPNGDGYWIWASDDWFFISPKGKKLTSK